MKKNSSTLWLGFFSFLLATCLTNCSERKASVSYSDTVVDKPILFAPGIISTETNNEFEMGLSPDGKTIYFTRRIGDEMQKIYVSNFENRNWSTPELASFSTDRDEMAFVTPDGNTLYFGSSREIPGKPNLGSFDMNVWKVQRIDEGWSEPEPLPEPINYVQEEGEKWPSSNNNYLFTIDGKTHYFTTMMRGGKAIDLYTSELSANKFSKPERIDGLFENDSIWKYSACLSPNGQFLVFNSYDAPGGKGGEDLFVSKKTENGWSKAKGIDLINSEGEESGGRFSPDGRYFFYAYSENLGNYEYGPWSIYFIETEYLDLEGLFD